MTAKHLVKKCNGTHIFFSPFWVNYSPSPEIQINEASLSFQKIKLIGFDYMTISCHPLVN